jgi:PilZ domain
MRRPITPGVDRVKPKQLVTINLDGRADRYQCFVRSVVGTMAILGQFGGIDPGLRARLNPGSLGYLAVAQEGLQLALRGVLTTAPDDSDSVAFVMLDADSLPERRRQERIKVVTVARVRLIDYTGADQPAEIETVTADVSVGGALIEARPGLDIGAYMLVDLCFPGFAEPVHCKAKIVRQAGDRIGVQFIDIDERHRARLSVILAHCRRRTQVA